MIEARWRFSDRDETAKKNAPPAVRAGDAVFTGWFLLSGYADVLDAARPLGFNGEPAN